MAYIPKDDSGYSGFENAGWTLAGLALLGVPVALLAYLVFALLR